jgi:soluble P-type ATPase
VVLTSSAPNIFEVEFATRLMRNDPEEKMNVVEEMFRRYSVALSIGDIGDAFDLTHKLQRKY